MVLLKLPCEYFDVATGRIEGVLHIQRDGAAQGVETEHGIVTLHRQPVHGELRNQVPVDVVAEGFVEPRAV